MNKDLFLYVYKNKVLNIIINNQIRYIHRKIDKSSKKQTWDDITPIVLAQYGYYDQFKKLGAYYDILRCGRAAARYGHIDILKYIYREGIPTENEKLEFYKMALQGGKIPIIEYIYNTIDPSFICHDYLELASIGGVDSCQWIVDHVKNVELTCNQTYFYDRAILSGNLDSLKWGITFFNKVSQVRYEGNGKILWEKAIQSKNISLLEYMSNQEPFKSLFDLMQCMFGASTCGNFEVIDWVFSKNDKAVSLDDKTLFSNLLIYGTIRAIKYFSVKFSSNNNNIAEWFFIKCEQHGFNAIDTAIKHSKHKILIWLYEQTSFQGTLNPLDHNPPFEVLKWFTEHKRPERISSEQLRRFAVFGDMTKVEYVIKNRTEQFPNLPAVKRLCLLFANDLIELLPPSDVSLSEYDFKIAITQNRFNSVKWIHSNTTTRCSDSAILSAYFLQDSTMIEWLHQNRTESFNTEFIKSRFNRFSTSVRSFILHNKPELIPLNVLELVSDDFTLSKFIIDNSTQYIFKDSLFAVSKSGNVEIVKYLCEYYKKLGINHFNPTLFEQTWKLAIKNQFNDLFKYLYENHWKKLSGKKSTNNPMFIACKHGCLDICKYLQENTPFKLSIDHMDQASINGHLHVVRWIYENHRIKCSNNGLFSTAFNEHFRVVRYLIDNKHNVTSNMFKNAVINSQLDIVKIYQNHHCKLDFNVIDIASEKGRFEMVKYFFENGHKGTTDAIDSAAEHGHLDIIKYLRNNGHKCTSKSIKSAYYNKHSRVVKWLLKHIEFPTSEMPTIDITLNDSKNLVLEYINKQKIKENEIKKRDADPIAQQINKKLKK